MVDVSRYIERAEQEAKRRNYDHAITLYQQILEIDPDCAEASAGFLRAALKKHDRRYPSAIERVVLNLPVQLVLPVARLAKAHGWIASLCRGALRRDPRNAKLNHRLGTALLQLGHRRSAEAAFQVATEYGQADIGSLKTLGRLAYERKDLDKALDCYEKALKINPRDQEAARMRKNLAAEGAIQKGGYEGARSARDLAKSERQLKEAERAQKIVRSAKDVAEAIAEVEEELEKEPEDTKLLVRLGDLHVQNRELDRAVDAYMRASKADPEDHRVADRLGDVRIRRFDARIAEAERAVKAGEEGAESRVKRLRQEQLDLQIEEFERRVRIHPTDMSLRFRLGRCLLRDERPDEAIEQFQQAVKDPKHRVGSLHLMGRAFAGKGILDLAIKQLGQAAEAIPGMTDQRKDILYDLAKVHERHGDHDEALAILKQIYETDIGYRDVGRRIESLSG